MKWNINKSSLLWLAGVLLIGVASNAIWEFAFRPAFFFAQSSMLTLITLGIQQYKDAIYIEIARGHYDRASVALFLESLGVICGVATAFVVISYLGVSYQRKKLNEIKTELSDIDNVEASKNSPAMQPIKFGIDNTESLLKKLFRLVSLNAILVTFLLVITTSTAIKTVYVQSAVVHYEQLLAITSPYTTEDEKKRDNSLFAQITSRTEYEQIVSSLRAIAEKNGQRVPQFNIW